jgi:hypothetical protein
MLTIIGILMKTVYFALSIFSSLLLAGCATTSNVGYAWFGTSVDHDWGTGGVIWSHESTYSLEKVTSTAQDYCRKKGLPPPSFRSYSTPSQNNSEYYRYEFNCDKREPINRPEKPTAYRPNSEAPVTTTQSIDSSMSLEDAKKKCTDIGFQPATEAFGKCVLRLSK